MDTPPSLWSRLPFLVRLMITAGFALLVAGSLMLGVSVADDGRTSREDLRQELAAELATLPAALAEVVVVGDFSTLQQTLDRYVRLPRISAARFADPSGTVVQSHDVAVRAQSPRWFRTLQGVDDLTGDAEVRVGGRVYGVLTLTLAAQSTADRIWGRLLNHLAILALAVGLDFLGIWLVLRNGLEPLQVLRHGAMALAEGDLDRRLPRRGSPELRAVIDAFNHMATRLQTAQGQLVRRNEELRRFSEIAAHHLQEPTRRVIIFSQRIRTALGACPESGEAQVSLDFIIQEAGRLRNLLRDIELYLAAPQPLGLVQPLNSGIEVQAVVRAQGAALEEAKAVVEVGPLPPVTLDRRRFQDVLAIALDNALRYRRPDVPLRTEVSAEIKGDRVRLRIADNGQGVSPEYRERAFRVFERLYPRPGETSTGIGLSIVRRVAEATGGNAWFEDGLDGGVTLVIDLPLGQPT